MSIKDFKKFVNLVSKDKVLANKVREAGTDPEKIISLGKEKNLSFSRKDMKAAHDEIATPNKELSEEDLEKVAGGFVTSTAVALAGAAGSVATAAISVATAAHA